MARLKENDSSKLLHELAEKVGRMSEEEMSEATKLNIYEMTVIGGMKTGGVKGDKEVVESVTNECVTPVATYENVFEMNTTDDFYEHYANSDAIVVKNGVGNDRDVVSWDMNVYKNLKELIIGDKCFWYMNGLELEGMSVLEKLVIGSGCFSRSEGGLKMIDCEKLKSVSIGKGCCVKWNEFVIMNCGVERVEIGDGCFSKTEGRMELNNCKKLKSLSIRKGMCVKWNEFVLKNCGVENVEIGSKCFVDCTRMVFEDLNELQSLRIGAGSMNGSESVLVMKSEQ